MFAQDFRQYSDIIMKCPLFRGLDSEEAMTLPVISEGVLISPASGEVVSSDYLYIILEGGMRIETLSADNRNISLKTALPGAAVNAASVLSPEREMSRLIAQKGSRFLLADEHAVRSSLQSGGIFSINYTEFLVDRIQFLNSRIVSFSGYGTESRLIHYLTEHEKDGEVVLPSAMSRFAQILGVGRASLYRAIEHMEEEGVITRDGRTIHITGELNKSGTF